MTTLTTHGTSSQVVGSTRQLLHELDQERRDQQADLDRAQVMLDRVAKSIEQSYHRRRRAILANDAPPSRLNGHADTAE